MLLHSDSFTFPWENQHSPERLLLFSKNLLPKLLNSSRNFALTRKVLKNFASERKVSLDKTVKLH